MAAVSKIQGAPHPDLGPRVSIGTYDNMMYVGWIVGDTEDGGIEIQHRDKTRSKIAKSRIEVVTYLGDG